MRLPTVAIRETNGSRAVINESDYDPEKHELWSEEQPPPPQSKGPEDPDERIAAIVEAIDKIDRDDEQLWTGDGRPTVNAVEQVLEYDITADERNEAWRVRGEK